jgi:hypothetical protein
MRKLFVALAMAMAVCLASATVALADGAPPSTQGADQSASTSQIAGATSSAQQVQPQNINISVRILSPGNDGDVTQINNAGSSANAGNSASTTQNANQTQGGSGTQGAEQSADTGQLGAALSAARQAMAANWNIPVRNFSPSSGSPTMYPASGGSTTSPASTGSDPSSCGCSTTPPPPAAKPAPGGSTTQSNTAGSNAGAGNDASTNQGATQNQGSSCGCGGSGGTQGASQSADTSQAALAASKAVQIDPSNNNISVRILSPGNDGNVTQTNSVTSNANAGNRASTEQRASQGQGGSSCGCPPPVRTAPDPQSQDASQPDPQDASQLTDATQPAAGQPDSSDPSVDSATAPASSPAIGVQGIGQDASTKQLALAGSSAEQKGASNSNYPVRIGSYGNGGDVTQTNSVTSNANAGNDAWTNQYANQSGSGSSCGCASGSGVQGIGQKADTEQGSLALSKAIQDFGDGESRCGCEGGSGGGNVSSPVRLWSPGTDGSTTQSNTVDSSANAGNRAGTRQTATQNSGAGGLQVQGIGQEAWTGQGALAGSLAAQFGASNDSSPVRLWSPGGGGSVNQTNSASSKAGAGNDAYTSQTGNQSIGASPCGCFRIPIQAIGQQAGTDQFGFAGSGAFQLFPSNSSYPVRLWSFGDEGWGSQKNLDGSQAWGGNRGGTNQSASQLT